MVVWTVASLSEDSGGPARSVPGMCRALMDTGASVEIVTTGSVSHMPTGLQGSGVEVHICRMWQPPFAGRSAGWAPRFEALTQARLREESQPIVHDNGCWMQTNLAAAHAARRQECPLIVSPRGMLEPWSLGHRAVRKKTAWLVFQGRILRRAHVLHATSLQEATNLRVLGLTQPVAVIPNGVVSPTEFVSSAKPGSASGAGPRLALFLGRIHPQKGLLDLVAAWAQVRPGGWRLLIAGPEEGRHGDEVRAAVQEHGLMGEVAVGGPVTGAEKWKLLGSAQLVILPTKSESFGVVVAEALGQGVPVITTREAPWEELVRHDCGWWCDIGCLPLTEAIAEATALDAQRLAEMGSRGRALVDEKYAWPALAAQMRQVYEWMLGGGAPPACMITN